jgi:hypothetical protein
MRSINTFLHLAIVAGACVVSLPAGDKKKVEETVISGTVFRDPGYALPEATVTLIRRDDPKRKKLAEMVTSYRGEFSIHVPATPQVYVLKASAKGYRPEEKEASVTGLDGVDVMFILEPEKKK